MMNCREGDLAICIKSAAGNEGKIFKCVKGIGYIFFLDADDRLFRDFAWQISPDAANFAGMKSDLMPDSFLKPIQGDGDVDDITTHENNKDTVSA